MNQRFTNKVALITGGGSGIGRHLARAFAAEGATIVVAGRTEHTLAETVRLIADDGGHASTVTVDVTSADEVAAMVDAVLERHGRLDVAVNNAGIVVAGPVADIDETQWSAAVATNLTGVWLCLKHEISAMRENSGGTIVNVSSNVGAHQRIAGLGAYATTKAAVSALTRAAARDHIAEGIRINAVSPGPIDTPMSMRADETPADRAARLKNALPLGRVGTLDEVASAVLWLAAPESGFTVGHDLVVDGGATA